MTDAYLRHLAALGRSPRTIAYVRLFLTRIEDDLGTDLVAASEAALLAWLDARRKQVTGTTVSGEIGLLRAYLSWARDEGAVGVLPRLPARVRGQSSVRAVLTVDQVRRLLTVAASLGKREHAMVELLYGAGLRRRELMALDLYDIDWAAGVVRVRMGKNRRDRWVPVPPSTLAPVRDYVETAREPAEPGSLALFVNAAYGRINDHQIERLFERLGARISFGVPVSCYTLRHSVATHLLAAGVDLALIAAFLGHADVTTTQVYTRVEQSDLRRAMESVWRGIPPTVDLRQGSRP